MKYIQGYHSRLDRIIKLHLLLRRDYKSTTQMKYLNFYDFHRLGQLNVDRAMKLSGEWNKSMRAIAAEITDYTQSSFEEGRATFETLLLARSIEQAIEIQNCFAKRAYDSFLHHTSKIGGMYAELAKEPCNPVAKAIHGAR
jgi:hypothetical protein